MFGSPRCNHIANFLKKTKTAKVNLKKTCAWKTKGRLGNDDRVGCWFLLEVIPWKVEFLKKTWTAKAHIHKILVWKVKACFGNDLV